MFRRAICSLLALSLLITVAMGGMASAASVSSGSGIRLSPVRNDLIIDPGQSKTVQLILQNVTNGNATFQAIVNDFTTNNNQGTPELIVGKDANNPHGLRQYISPIPNITVGANKAVPVNVTITIPKDVTGGGYYGAVRFAPVSSGSSKTVSISASVASLILVTVPGPGLNENLSLTSLVAEKNGDSGSLFYSNKGIQVAATFYNGGNVQLEPYGKITVQDMAGNVIETKLINTANPPGNVLPGSSRVFTVNLDKLGTFGKYKVTANFGYGNQGHLLSATTTFYVVAPWMIAVVVIIVLLIVLLIAFMPRIFRAWYKRSVNKGNGKK